MQSAAKRGRLSGGTGKYGDIERDFRPDFFFRSAIAGDFGFGVISCAG
jgi:hypothetical protein